MTSTNREVHQIQNYLSNNGLYPNRISSSYFEESRQDIEQLPLLDDPQSVALHALERLKDLVPGLDNTVYEQVRGRLKPDAINFVRAGNEARSILNPMTDVYERGSIAYLTTIVAMLNACQQHGHHLPCKDAVFPLRRAQAQLTGNETTLSEVLDIYSATLEQAAHRFTPVGRVIRLKNLKPYASVALAMSG